MQKDYFEHSNLPENNPLYKKDINFFSGDYLSETQPSNVQPNEKLKNYFLKVIDGQLDCFDEKTSQTEWLEYLDLYIDFMRELTKGYYPSFFNCSYSKWSEHGMGEPGGVWVNSPINLNYHARFPKSKLFIFTGDSISKVVMEGMKKTNTILDILKKHEEDFFNITSLTNKTNREFEDEFGLPKEPFLKIAKLDKISDFFLVRDEYYPGVSSDELIYYLMNHRKPFATHSGHGIRLTANRKIIPWEKLISVNIK